MTSSSAQACRSVYVYYRVTWSRRAEAHDAVQALQATLSALQPGLQARLYVRADAARAHADPTWMETYQCPPHGVSDACLERMHEVVAQWPSGLTSERHVEIFQPVAPADTGCC